MRYEHSRERYVVRLADGTEAKLPRGQLDVAKTVGGIFRSNSHGFSPSGTSGDCALVALYSIACRANHSCDPNLRKEFDDKGTLFYYATRAVPAGDELLTSYGGSQLTLQRRREHLSEQYAFWCRCGRCMREERRAGAP